MLGAGQKYNEPPLFLEVNAMLKCNSDHYSMAIAEIWVPVSECKGWPERKPFSFHVLFGLDTLGNVSRHVMLTFPLWLFCCW